MSVFECKNFHQMSTKDIRCRTCGEPMMYLDGMTSEQWSELERRIYAESSKETEKASEKEMFKVGKLNETKKDEWGE